MVLSLQRLSSRCLPRAYLLDKSSHFAWLYYIITYRRLRKSLESGPGVDQYFEDTTARDNSSKRARISLGFCHT
jgi:hypothetical protein